GRGRGVGACRAWRRGPMPDTLLAEGTSVDVALQVPPSPHAIVEHPQELPGLGLHEVVVALDGPHPPAAARAERALDRHDRSAAAEPGALDRLLAGLVADGGGRPG